MTSLPKAIPRRGLGRFLADLRALAAVRLRAAGARLRARPLRAAGALFGAALLLGGAAYLRRSAVDDALTATARRGTLVARLSEIGILRPAESITYHAPLAGRESEIVFLVPEGTKVGEGDLVVRLDTSELERELERALQELRQAQVDLQVAEVEKQDAMAGLESVTEGAGALGVDEAQTALRLAERKAQRLRGEYEALKPLLEKGFITREELDRAAFELERAESELQIAGKKAHVLVERIHPYERERAKLQLVQKRAQAENVRPRLEAARARAKALKEAIESSSLYAKRPGLAVYEEFLGASPRRKVRVGDRVTRSQGIVTIPEVSRMVAESSVREADVHRVRPGQPAVLHVEAFPGRRLTGRVARVGTLARSSADRPFGDKRFDLVVEVDPVDADLKPEMTVRVDVVVGELKDVLLVPVNAVFERRGLLVAHVVRSFRVETRPVELGETDDVLVEVVAGLREGDRVALTDVGSAVPPRGATVPGADQKAPYAVEGRP